MKKINTPIVFIVLVAVVFTTAGFTIKNKTSIKETTHAAPSKGFAVVELFTSEGCSSCPLADETVARLLSKNIENVYILAYHVDYWDRLGWKDPFSKSQYSERQNQYASRFNLNSVYTPQVIVNGSSEFVGSDEEKLTHTVENNLNKETDQNINITSKKNSNNVTVNYEINRSDEVFLNVALVQAEATTSVKRGENGGRTLHHVNIVRALKTIDAKGKGNVILEIPNEISNLPLQIIAFTQSKKSFQILGADKKPI